MHPPVDGDDGQDAGHHQRRQDVQVGRPAAQREARRQLPLQGVDQLVGELHRHQGQVGADPEQGVEAPGLVDPHDVVGEGPELQGQGHAAPQLGHDVEQGEGPVPGHGGEACGPGRQPAVPGLEGGHRLDALPDRVEEREQGEEHQERGQGRGEQRPPAQHVAEPGVGEHEHHRQGDGAVDLQERDQVGAGPGGGDHQGVLGVAQDRVDERDEEEHQEHGQELLQFVGVDRPEPLPPRAEGPFPRLAGVHGASRFPLQCHQRGGGGVAIHEPDGSIDNANGGKLGLAGRPVSR